MKRFADLCLAVALGFGVVGCAHTDPVSSGPCPLKGSPATECQSEKCDCTQGQCTKGSCPQAGCSDESCPKATSLPAEFTEF